VLAALGLHREHAALSLQLELHVYAGLCTRGQTVMAADFLATSPLRLELPEVIARMHPQTRPEKQAFAALMAERLANARVHQGG
jgi:hypothetical protein